MTTYNAVSGGSILTQVQKKFDGLGNLIQEWQSNGNAVNTSTTPSVQYGYSALDANNQVRLVSMTYPSGYVLNYNYSSGLNSTISRLSSISDSTGTLEAYSYMGLSTVVLRSHPQSGIDLTYIGTGTGDAGDQYVGLDRFGRIVDQKWVSESTGVATDELTYTYDQDGNRLTQGNAVNSAFSETYTYDGLNQLATFSRGSGTHTQTFNYDSAGNRTSVVTNGTTQTYSANAQNEITGVSGATTPTYDSNGNMTTDETGRQFVYDAWNRIVAVKNSSGTVLETYTYDGLGRRVAITASGTTTNLYYSSQWQVLEEAVGGATKARYVWSPVYVDAMILRDRDPGTGSLSERLWVQQDANFDVTAIVNGSGTVVERYAYDPYGVATVMNASWTSLGSSAYNWIYLHQGGRLDATSGLYWFRNRDYSATLGRWVTMDPMGYSAGDVNLYRVEDNSSPNFIDPIGLKGTLRVYAFEGAGGKWTPIVNAQPLAENTKGMIGEIVANSAKSTGVTVDYNYYAWDGIGAETDIKNRIKADKVVGHDPSACGTTYMILGYSWGGYTAARVAKNVSNATGYKFPLVFTIDPVTYGRVFETTDIGKTFNAKLYSNTWVNYYQKTDTKTLPVLSLTTGIQGEEIGGADNSNVIAADFNSVKLDALRGHTNILYYGAMRERLADAVRNVATSVMDW